MNIELRMKHTRITLRQYGGECMSFDAPVETQYHNDAQVSYDVSFLRVSDSVRHGGIRNLF